MVDNVDCRRPLPLPPYLVTFRPAPDVASLPADVPPRRQPATPPPDIRAGGHFRGLLRQRQVPFAKLAGRSERCAPSWSGGPTSNPALSRSPRTVRMDFKDLGPGSLCTRHTLVSQNRVRTSPQYHPSISAYSHSNCRQSPSSSSEVAVTTNKNTLSAHSKHAPSTPA